MQPSQLSSGDVIADRRADYARMLDEGGEPDAAAELMEQALELVPAWAAGWYRLATYQEKVGKTDAAVEAYRRTLELDPEDVFGSSLKLAMLGDTETPAQPPSRYVERLFDDYADRFETSLVEKLDYSVPQKRPEGTIGVPSISAAVRACSALKSAPKSRSSKVSTCRRTCWRRLPKSISTTTSPRQTCRWRPKPPVSLPMARGTAPISSPPPTC
jgi:tetratricopeptide (TPR) repeat protein